MIESSNMETLAKVKDITKKKFQEMLNSWDREKRGNKKGEIVDGYRNWAFHQRTRLYGDYVRSQDLEMFNDLYRRYTTGYDQQDLDKYL